MAERVTAPMTRDDMSKLLSDHRLAVTRSEHLVSLLVLEYNLYESTKNPDCLRSMLTLLDEAEPSIKYGSYTSTKGVEEFKDFEQELSDEYFGLVAEELKVVFPNMRHLDRGVIKAVHNIICSEEDPEEQQGNGDKVKLGNNEENAMQLSKGDSRTVLSWVRQCIKSMNDYMDKSITAIAEQHGGITKNGPLNELMTKLRNAVNKFEIQVLLEQVSAFHAMVVASDARELSHTVNTLGQYLDKVLTVTEDE
ncbi:hypothetical protein DL764_003688 [Monosporascus ibericus]|uniref:Uncharacterized protein n=1 Tax=Monosporascus ibericus TaxID=155417 RepID=A0A4Q4TFH7_9PEZI|nr:hypothetical protein DL764_003688 [Monosporascus ibericus]